MKHTEETINAAKAYAGKALMDVNITVGHGYLAGYEKGVEDLQYELDKSFQHGLNMGRREKDQHIQELVEALEVMTAHHEKQATWDKGNNGYYNAKKLIQKFKKA